MNIPLVLNDGAKLSLSYAPDEDGKITQLEFEGEIDITGKRVHVMDSPFEGNDAELITHAMQIAEGMRRTYQAEGEKQDRKEAKKRRGKKSKDEAAEAEATQIDASIEDGTEEEEPHIEFSEYEKRLKCFLSDDEKQKAASSLVQAMEDLKRKEDDLTAIKNQFKGECSRIQADIDHFQGLVRDGYRFDDVLCKVTRNYKTENVTIVRLDTGEIIEDRRLRGDEMQRKLPGME
jgi:hypothetical protein